MKLWIDDIRTPPGPDWNWAKTSVDAKLFVMYAWINHDTIDVISFDHDLGGDDTTRPVVLWMCEHDYWPRECRVHSANPVGREWLEGMISRYGPSNNS